MVLLNLLVYLGIRNGRFCALVLILMMGTLLPWLTNHVFAQRNTEITKSNNNSKKLCVMYLYLLI